MIFWKSIVPRSKSWHQHHSQIRSHLVIVFFRQTIYAPSSYICKQTEVAARFSISLLLQQLYTNIPKTIPIDIVKAATNNIISSLPSSSSSSHHQINTITTTTPIKNNNSISALSIETLLRNIGAGDKMSRAEIEDIVSEVGVCSRNGSGNDSCDADDKISSSSCVVSGDQMMKLISKT